MIRDRETLLHSIRRIHEAIRDDLIQAGAKNSLEDLSEVVAEEGGDTIFAIDKVSEATLVEQFESLAQSWSFVLIAEGLGETGRRVFPEGTSVDRAEMRIIIDPIDGTRGLMYQKRPAWILTGVALNRGEATNLSDIELAVQTEIPLIKQHLCDQLWAVRNEGCRGERFDRISGKRAPLVPQPSRSQTLAQGFGNLARFFPGFRKELADIEDKVIERIMGPPERGKAHCYEDQYITSGGQLYEILMGHDRWIADLRPLMESVLKDQGKELGLCAHPYDLCTELIAREAGIIVINEQGEPLSAPLDVSTGVTWIGYSNPAIRNLIEPPLLAVLREKGIIS